MKNWIIAPLAVIGTVFSTMRPSTVHKLHTSFLNSNAIASNEARSVSFADRLPSVVSPAEAIPPPNRESLVNVESVDNHVTTATIGLDPEEPGGRAMLAAKAAKKKPVKKRNPIPVPPTSAPAASSELK